MFSQNCWNEWCTKKHKLHSAVRDSIEGVDHGRGKHISACA